LVEGLVGSADEQGDDEVLKYGKELLLEADTADIVLSIFQDHVHKRTSRLRKERNRLIPVYGLPAKI
ncbi:hypothetical protein FRC03_008263, partial [Tulasnella sp. 419]